MELLKCPCQGETQMHIEQDEYDCVRQVRCAKCGACGDAFIGFNAYDCAVEQWNTEVEKGYVPHAGGKMRGVIVV